jgi:hypothetical protein
MAWAEAVKRLLAIVGTGLVFFVASETLFWGMMRPEDTLADIAPAPLAYIAAAWVFSVGLSLAGRIDRSSVFLAGCLMGWFAEGVIVDTLTETLPFSIPWTGMAWHALISAVAMFWLGGAAIAQGGARFAVFLAAAAGGFGLWAAWWPAERADAMALAPSVAFAFANGVVLAAGYALAARAGLAALLTPRRWEAFVVGGVVVLLWCLRFVENLGLERLVLPAVALPTLLLLHRLGRRWPAEAPTAPARAAPLSRLIAVALLPPAAVALAFAVWAFGYVPATNQVTALITVSLALFFYAAAVRHALKRA